MSLPLLLACHDDHPAQPGLDLRPLPAAREEADPAWHRVRVGARDLVAAGMHLQHVDVPFMLYTEGRWRIEVARVGWHR